MEACIGTLRPDLEIITNITGSLWFVSSISHATFQMEEKMKKNGMVFNKVFGVILILAFLFSAVMNVQPVQAQTFAAYVGLVVDAGGLDDNGLNELAYQGLLDAETTLGIAPSTYVVVDDRYDKAIEDCVSGGNDLCIAVGFMFGGVIGPLATANPTIKFALIDSTISEAYPANFRSIEFKIKEVGYLAGALAGKMTATDIIGTVGGMDIPPVNGFMDGYKNGAECANDNMIVLSDYTNNFTDPNVGADMAKDMIAKGADVIFSVAGYTGYGSSWYAAEHDKFTIGVDSDFYYNAFGNGTVAGSDMLLSSAMKNYDVAVYTTIDNYLNLGDDPWTGALSYGVSDNGVDLAPYHETDSLIPDVVKQYVDDVRDGIDNGSISVDASCTLATPTAKVGMVIDTETLKDNPGWNGMAYQGMVRAHADLGIYPTVYEGSDDLATKVESCVSDGNDLCVGTGWSFFDAIQTAAGSYPAVSFANLDSTYETPPDNLRGISYRAKEAAYLAGALASKMSASNKMGVVGGMEIPPVVILVEGYQNGAQCTSPNSLVLTQYAGTFGDPDLGATIAADMISQGAATIFGAAGPTGDGAIKYAAQHDKWAIGVDADEYVSLFESGAVDGSDMILSSAMKRLDNATYDTIDAFLGVGTFGGNVEYGLIDDGVGLAPYHETDAVIPADVKTYIETLKTGIIGGTISVDTTCYAPGAFIKKSPVNGAVNQPANPILKWAKSSNTATYEYCIDKVNDNKCTTGWKSVGTATSKALSGLTAGTYYWQVRAKNARTLTNSTGGYWHFTVPAKPAAFSKTLPANNAVNQPTTLTLTWAASANAAKYEYCLKTVLSAACTWKSVGTAKKVTLTGLLKNKKYYWQVRASNAVGIVMANGGVVWNFKTKP
jgi:basic membrane protein A and related proteins